MESNNNKFITAGAKCVFSDDKYYVYRIDTVEQAILTTKNTNWCMMKPATWAVDHSDEKYVVVKKLPNNHVKIIVGLDLGYGLIRTTGNQIIPKKQIQPIKHIIEHMFNEKVVASIIPKGTDDYEIPDIWFHRNLSTTLRKLILSNKKIVESVYQNRFLYWPFYKANYYPFLRKIIRNKKIIIDEICSNINDDALVDFLADFYDEGGEKVNGKWLTSQFYYNKKNKTKINKPHLCSREAKYKWVKNLREGPKMFPETCKILEKCNNIYWAGISKIGPNSHIKPHKHSYANPTRIFQICIDPGSGEGECVLIADGKKLNWNYKYQINIFDGRSKHELINTMDSSRYILHIEFDPGENEFKNI